MHLADGPTASPSVILMLVLIAAGVGLWLKLRPRWSNNRAERVFIFAAILFTVVIIHRFIMWVLADLMSPAARLP